MKPEPAKFSRDNPCTKLHLHNCFATADGYAPRPVVDAQAEIGLNAPRYMERKGYLHCVTRKSVDYYVLTSEGEQWIAQGIARYIKNHPSEAGRVKYTKMSAPVRRVIRLRR